MRVESQQPVNLKSGETGWIHGVDEDIESKRLPKDEAPKLSVEQLTRIAVRMYEHERAARTRENLAESLGVSLSSLDLLRVGYGMDRWGREFASFPARDERGRVVGIVRRYPDGKKLSWEGGSTGLFYERGWHKRTGPVLIVEGASDVAACISAGLPAIGRPSNTGGVDRIAAMLKRHNRRAVVIGEDDEDPSKRGQTQHCPEDCTGCLKCYPGKVGAMRVSQSIGFPWTMPPDGCKDIRGAWRAGKLWPSLISTLDVQVAALPPAGKLEKRSHSAVAVPDAIR